MTPVGAPEGTLIKGGSVVNADVTAPLDILVIGERIAEVAPWIDPGRHLVIDASDTFILPGGIDPHVHIGASSAAGGIDTADDFTTGTTAAAFGGTTTIIDFCMQQRGERLTDAVERWRTSVTRAPPLVDVAAHIAICDMSVPRARQDLADLVSAGYSSFKVFMAYRGGMMVRDDTLYRVLAEAAALDAIVMVHAENGDVIYRLQRDVPKNLRSDIAWHSRTRPPLLEAEATARAIYLARQANAQLYIVHVSCADALAALALSVPGGTPVFAETCTHYLYADASQLEGDELTAAKHVFSPPPRAANDRQALRDALMNGILQVVSSDHSPFLLADKRRLRGDFVNIPNGAPGVEDRLRMLYSREVRNGKMTLNQLVDLTATSPAKIFGLYPTKGAIVKNADADLVIFDPAPRRILKQRDPRMHHTAVDYNLYEGVEILGTPRTVIVRGRAVIKDGALVGRPGDGRVTPRIARRLAPPRCS